MKVLYTYPKKLCEVCDEFINSSYMAGHKRSNKRLNNLIRQTPVDDSIKTIDKMPEDRKRKYELEKDKSNCCTKCYATNICDKRFNTTLKICLVCDKICRGGTRKCFMCKQYIDIGLFERPLLKRCKACANDVQKNYF